MDVKNIVLSILVMTIIIISGCITNNDGPEETPDKIEIIFIEDVNQEMALNIVNDYNITVKYIGKDKIQIMGDTKELYQVYATVNNSDETEIIINSLNMNKYVYSCELEKRE